MVVIVIETTLLSYKPVQEPFKVSIFTRIFHGDFIVQAFESQEILQVFSLVVDVHRLGASSHTYRLAACFLNRVHADKIICALISIVSRLKAPFQKKNRTVFDRQMKIDQGKRLSFKYKIPILGYVKMVTYRFRVTHSLFPV